MVSQIQIPINMKSFMKSSFTAMVIIYALIASGFLVPQLTLAAKGYYVDCSASANGDGTIENPWNNLSVVNDHTPFMPGDSIYVKRGTTCFGELWPKGSGDSTAQIVLCAYGTDTVRPVINAQGKPNSAAIRLNNQEYWTIEGFGATNPATTEASRLGISVYADDGQVKHRIRIRNNVIYNVYGNRLDRLTGGIAIDIREPGHADDVLIEGNMVRNVLGGGISFWAESEFWRGGMQWDNLSPHVVVRYNKVVLTSMDGIFIGGTDNELVEYNVVDSVSHLGIPGTVNTAGMWPTRHRNGVWQFNEVSHTRLLIQDGQGFDNDLFVQGTTIFQYNYSHDNEGGFFLDCCGPDGGKTVVRYNISVNEPMFNLMRGNTDLYNNVFYSPGRAFEILGSARFKNNIFWGIGIYGNNQVMDYNNYYGGMAAPANDLHAIVSDPEFINPGRGGNGLNTLDGYKVDSTSHCIGSGLLIQDNGGRDFWGNQISAIEVPNRGADGFYHDRTSIPRIVNVTAIGDSTLVIVGFSEPVEDSSATKVSNYVIDNGVTILSAVVAPDSSSVGLHTSPLTENVSYVLTVSNVRDRSALHNQIIPNSQAGFMYLRSLPQVLNPSFESPAVSDYQYGTVDIVWTYNGGSGIVHNSSAFGNDPAPNGVQAAFLQNVSSISQPITLGSGKYRVRFKAAQRNRAGNNQTVKIYLDNMELGLFTPSGTIFIEYATDYCIVPGGSYQLKIAGTASSGDNTVFIDEVAIEVAGLGTDNEPIAIMQEGLSLAASPNPFNPSVNIQVAGWRSGMELKVFNVSGRVVADLTKLQSSGMGQRQVVWNAAGQASGVYLVILKHGKKELKRKIMLIR